MDDEVGNCLDCGGECNFGSQLCSFCMRKGFIPDTKNKCEKCNSLNCYFGQCSNDEQKAQECMTCEGIMYTSVKCNDCKFYVCHECAKTAHTKKGHDKPICIGCRKDME